MKWIVGQRVIATCTIVAELKSAHDGQWRDYVHAEQGDKGEVVHVADNDLPTVRFTRTGLATIVNNERGVEIEPDLRHRWRIGKDGWTCSECKAGPVKLTHSMANARCPNAVG